LVEHDSVMSLFRSDLC